jgi:hypothetical protein
MNYPEELTLPLHDVLSLLIYETVPLAHLWRANGYPIAKQVEAEHAFVLHWLIKLALQHGEQWPRIADLKVQELKRNAIILTFFGKK